MVLFILLWASIFTVIGIIVGTQNGNTLIDISILVWSFHNIPLTLVLIETFAIGVIFTIIVAVIDEIRLKNRLWRKRNEINELKKELTALRNLPVEKVETDIETKKPSTEESEEKKDEKSEESK
jgi:uncharacterized integral membrane protein